MFLAVVASAAPAAADCSNMTLKGGFGFSLTGTNYIRDAAFALVGSFVADGAGRFSGVATQSIKGQVGRGTFSGKYKIEKSCDGSATIIFASGSMAQIDFVVVDNGDRLEMISADQGTLETGSATRIATQRQASRPAAVQPTSADAR
jgi:hypothetical protein